MASSCTAQSRRTGLLRVNLTQMTGAAACGNLRTSWKVLSAAPTWERGGGCAYLGVQHFAHKKGLANYTLTRPEER